MDAVVYYKIKSPMAAVCNVEDYQKSTRLLASTTLRTTLGMKSLSEILSDREHTSIEILKLLDEATDPWGIKVGILYFEKGKNNFKGFHIASSLKRILFLQRLKESR